MEIRMEKKEEYTRHGIVKVITQENWIILVFVLSVTLILK